MVQKELQDGQTIQVLLYSVIVIKALVPLALLQWANRLLFGIQFMERQLHSQELLIHGVRLHTETLL